MTKQDIFAMFMRYALLIALALPGMQLFYAILTPLTIYPAFLILSMFYKGIYLLELNFVFNTSLISITPACIAASAYYLLLILNLTTPMPLKTRFKSLAFLLSSFLIINILRLVIFTSLFIGNFQYFSLVHKASWYFTSTLLVIILWFFNVYLFKIKSVPAYTDMANLVELYKTSRRKR